MKITKSKSKLLIFLFSVLIIVGCVLMFMPQTSNIADAAIGENKITSRISGTINGTLQKQTDGSITFNGQEIASASENLSQMYVILQGAGGAGPGDAGGFALVLIKFIPIILENGGTTFASYELASAYGPTEGYLALDTSITLPNMGMVIAGGGDGGGSAHSADEASKHHSSQIVTKIENSAFNSCVEVVFQRQGGRHGVGSTRTSGDPSFAFTLSMYKNGRLTTKFFGHHVGGMSPRGLGGAASPYGRGGNGQYEDFLSRDIFTPPEDAHGYGAGGGQGLEGFLITHACESGRGGDGFIDILG